MHDGFRPSASLGQGQIDRTKTKAFESRLAEFKAATDEGIMPASTQTQDIREAKAASDEAGQAFRSDMWGG